jgi:muramoyltetrapeptide carboxypeptidase
VIKARRLEIGDTVGLVSPSGPVKSAAVLAGAAALEDMGLKVKMGQHVLDREGYLAGSDYNRARDINQMFADDQIKGIFCVRGGYGSARILDMLDYGLIVKNPKVVLGYSDITALHIALGKKAGLVTFHGPMVSEMGKDFPEYNRFYMERALFSDRCIGPIQNPDNERAIEVLFPGTARGPIKGGNLSLICSTIGTKYEIDTEGCLFFIEEIAEPPYKVDRMLNHLKMAGKFDRVAGIIFGQWTDCIDQRHPENGVDGILEEIACRQQKPCISNVFIGHGRYNVTIPLGCNALIDGGGLYVEETGVS